MYKTFEQLQVGDPIVMLTHEGHRVKNRVWKITRICETGFCIEQDGVTDIFQIHKMDLQSSSVAMFDDVWYSDPKYAMRHMSQIVNQAQVDFDDLKFELQQYENYSKS